MLDKNLENAELQKKQCVNFDQKTQTNKNKQSFQWTLQENIKYAESLKIYQHQLIHEYQRRSNKIFVRMSQIVETKSSEQCRTHHKKMIKRLDNIWNIMAFFREKIERSSNQNRKIKLSKKQQKIRAKELGKLLFEENLKLNMQKLREIQDQNRRHYHQNQNLIQFDQLCFPAPDFNIQQVPGPQIDPEQIFIINVSKNEHLNGKRQLSWNVNWDQQELEQNQTI